MQKGKFMDKEEKKQTGVSLFGQSERFLGSDPIEEMFALNLGDFISENLISEDLAKKVSAKANKKERLQNQLKELIGIYSSKNTLCVLNFSTGEETAIYTSIAKSIVQMLEVEKCWIHLVKNKQLIPVGMSGDKNENTIEINIKELLHQEIIEKDSYIYISMKSSTMPVGMITIKTAEKLEKDYFELVLSIANLLGTTITLQNEIEHNRQS